MISEGYTTLRYARIGTHLRLIQIHVEPVLCNRLREMGLCETISFRKISNGICLVCWVCGVRIALSHQLADKIIVAPWEEAAV